ncbi:hypothetical protein H072_7363 [Dactylellina haptotyla CBS 200.50]|uniref:Uncharacterized protein n=1 Tax=Dactylellina haptotyla (strain CBS 200.50) TaxID=1284197 RepID=S8BI00_DACHA|nr:hypothetical protein H072_7363 [Dactylellina haptotyla CBS 200.50]
MTDADIHGDICAFENSSVESLTLTFAAPELRSTSIISLPETQSSEDPLYRDYYDYVCQIVHRHPDIDALKCYLEREDGSDEGKTTVYFIDFIGSNPNPMQPIIHGICHNAEEVQTMLDELDEVVELRLIVVSHEKEIDRQILKTIGYDLDIDPRIFIEHMGTLFPKPSTYFATPYLPSEAARSPIEIHFGGGKSTCVLLQPGDARVKTNTVLVLMDSPTENLEAALRDFDRPTIRKRQMSSVSLAVPSRMNLTYRYLRRLSEFQPHEVDLSCEHPIYLILPLLHLCALETSMLLTWAEEKLYERRLPHNLLERDPYNAYITSEGFQQEIFTTTTSLKTHMRLPWLNCSTETSVFLQERLDCAFQDLDFLRDKAALVQQSVTDALNREAATESINEAKQSIIQSESVNKLTRLAFVFVPLTFATSVFGMNIREWQADDKVPRLTSFIIVSIVIAVGTIIVAVVSGMISHSIRKRWKKSETLRTAFGCSWLLGVFYALFSFTHRRDINRRLSTSLFTVGEAHDDLGDFEWLVDDGFLFGKQWSKLARIVYRRAIVKHEAKDLKMAEKMV